MKNKQWPTKKLGELCEIYGGDAAPQDKSVFKNGTVPFVRMQDLGRYHTTTDLRETTDKLTREAVDQLGLKIWQKGVILIPRSGSVYMNHRAILGVDSVVVSHIAILSDFNSEILPEYLFHSLSLIDLGRYSTKTTGIDSISFSQLRRIRIPLPSLKTQKQIVERMDKIAKAQKLNDELIQKSDELFQSLLYQELNPASKDWEEKKLGEICDVRDGTHESPKFYPSGIPLVTSKNLIGEDVDFKNINHISLEDHREIDKRSKVNDGDILFGMIGTIGNPVVVKKDRKFSIKNVGLIKSIASNPINYFVYYSLLSNFIQKQVKKFSRGGTQKFVSLGNLRNLKIKVPNKIIQKQIVAKLSAAQEYKKQLLKQKELLQELFDSTLSKAMRGELVK